MSNQLSETVLYNRLEAIRARLREWEIDAVWITEPKNRRWLSGFSGSSGQLLITSQTALLATDSRYWEQAKQEAPHFKLYEHRRRHEDTVRLLQEVGVQRVGLEASHVTLVQAAELRSIKDITWIELAETAELLRQTKSEEELALIEKAAMLTDQTMAQVPQLARPGISERALAWELEKYMRESGADKVAFDIIVASGPNSALPHHTPGERLLQPGDAIIVDLGANVAGYHSDLTRTFYLGHALDEHFDYFYKLVRQAQRRAIEGMKPGMTSKEIDLLARDVIDEADHGQYFGHGLGHGVGLYIHEAPHLSQRTEENVPAGLVLTVEPGIYIPGWGGVRIEDLVYLTSAGAVLLSHTPYEPLITI